MRDVRTGISRREALKGFAGLAGLLAVACDDSLATEPGPGSGAETRLSWAVALTGSHPYLADISTTPTYKVLPTAVYNTAFRPDAAAIVNGVLTIDAWDNETEMAAGGTRQQSWLTFAVPGFGPSAPLSGRFTTAARNALAPATGGIRPILALGRMATRTGGGSEWVYAGFNAAANGAFDYEIVSSGRRYLDLAGSFEIPLVSVGLDPAVVGVVKGQIEAGLPRNG